jgi:large subunit ribosomal protein L19
MTQEETTNQEVQDTTTPETVAVKTEPKNHIAEFSPGDIIKVHVKIVEGKDKKEKSQVFEGQVLAIKGSKASTGTFTVRKIVDGVGVERIFPFNAPTVLKVEVVEQFKNRRSKLYYLRTASGKRAKLKKKAK